MFLFRKYFDWKIALKLGIPAIIFCTLGALLTNYIPQKEIELTMSILLAILAILLIWSYRIKIKNNNQNLIAGGVISGFLAGLIGTGGAIRGITLAAFNLEKNTLIGTSALIDLGVDSSRAVVYISSGYFLKEFIVLLPIFAGVSFLGSWIGKLLVDKLSQKVFKITLLSVVLIASLWQIVKSFL